MPEISRFLGIVIAMFHRDHDPAHFHAYYGNDMVVVEIETGTVKGNFPRRALSHVLEWLEQHREELLLNWVAAKMNQPLNKIEPWSDRMPAPKLISAQYIGGYCLRLAFSDGIEAELCFEDELNGGVFEALRDKNYFRTFLFREQFGSIEWDNGADFSPEMLYQKASQRQNMTARR